MKKILSFVFVLLMQTYLVADVKINSNETKQEKKLDNSSNSESFEEEYENEEFDPLSGYNKLMTGFNDKVFLYVYDPVSQGYSTVVHKNIRLGVSNAFDNLRAPINFVNNLLQLKFTNATEELARFVLNSTFGLLGLIDVGDRIGLTGHPEDFGQTLGFYGVGAGPHIVIPFVGPSNLRDAISLAADSFLDPVSTNIAYEPYQIPHNFLESTGYKAFDAVNDYGLAPVSYKELTKDAIDLYPFLKNVYEQNREKLIKE